MGRGAEMRTHRQRHGARSARAGVVLAALLLAACAGRLQLAGHVRPVEESSLSFTSLGHTIQVDAYVPEGKGQRHPAAIILHGSGGIHLLAAQGTQRYAEALANRGIATYVVHYFDGTGTFTADDALEAREYWRWVRIVHDAVGWARARPEVRPSRVGLFGISLGAYVAVGAAATDPRVSRVVLLSGGLEPGTADSVRRFPSALLLHGTRDGVVPLAAEDTLARLLTRHRALVMRHQYPGEGHSFADSAAVDAVERSARFLADGAVESLREALERTERLARPRAAPRDTARPHIP
ncbi:MAG: dienelactone hydrolase family protein [Gemmatimonadaceae bacterium]